MAASWASCTTCRNPADKCNCSTEMRTSNSPDPALTNPALTMQDFRNHPGKWDIFISHCQEDAKDIALDAHYSFRDDYDLSSWLDVKMDDKSEAAMEEGVKNSTRVFVIISKHYFSRPFCLKELRWAKKYNKPTVVGIPPNLKDKIGELLAQCPEDLREIGGIDFKALDRSDKDYFALGIKKLVDPKAAGFLAPDGPGGHGMPADFNIPPSSPVELHADSWEAKSRAVSGSRTTARVSSWELEAASCRVCCKNFSPFRWRHNCRLCGQLVCDGCSKNRQILAEPARAMPQTKGNVGAGRFSPKEKSRVCNNCCVEACKKAEQRAEKERHDAELQAALAASQQAVQLAMAQRATERQKAEAEQAAQAAAGQSAFAAGMLSFGLFQFMFEEHLWLEDGTDMSEALSLGLAKLGRDGEPAADCLNEIFEAWLLAVDRALIHAGAQRVGEFMDKIRDLRSGGPDGRFGLQQKLQDRLGSLDTTAQRTLKGVLFRGGWELMSFAMFPEPLAGDTRNFIEQEILATLNSAGIRVVGDKIKGVQGVPASEFIIWNGSYKVEVNPKIFTDAKDAQNPSECSENPLPNTFARLRGMGRDAKDQSTMMQRRKRQEEQKFMSILRPDFVEWVMEREYDNEMSRVGNSADMMHGNQK